MVLEKNITKVASSMGSTGGRAREDTIVADMVDIRYNSVRQEMVMGTTVAMTVDTGTVLGVAAAVVEYMPVDRAETGVHVGVKGSKPILTTCKTEMCSSKSIMPTATKLGWDKQVYSRGGLGGTDG